MSGNKADTKLKIFGKTGKNFPEETSNGKVFLGGIITDDKFDPDEIITFENTAGRSAPNQWLGFSDRAFANEKLKIEFWIKFVDTIPPKVPGFGMKIYNIMYNDWLDDCVANEWCEVSLDVQNVNSGDGDHVLLIFDAINQLQTVRIAQFTITVGQGK